MEKFKYSMIEFSSVIISKRSPTEYDLSHDMKDKKAFVGTTWINTEEETVFILISVVNGKAKWKQIVIFKD